MKNHFENIYILILKNFTRHVLPICELYRLEWIDSDRLPAEIIDNFALSLIVHTYVMYNIFLVFNQNNQFCKGTYLLKADVDRLPSLQMRSLNFLSRIFLYHLYLFETDDKRFHSKWH